MKGNIIIIWFYLRWKIDLFQWRGAGSRRLQWGFCFVLGQFSLAHSAGPEVYMHAGLIIGLVLDGVAWDSILPHLIRHDRLVVVDSAPALGAIALVALNTPVARILRANEAQHAVG